MSEEPTKALATLCSAILLLGTGAAGAQERVEPSRSGPRIYGAQGYYLGVSGIYGLGIADLPGVGDVKDTGGFNLRIGHRFNRWSATELHVEWLNDFAYEGGGFAAWDLMLAERFYFIEGRFQPFALAGLGLVSKRDHGGGNARRGYGFGGRFGAGVDVYTGADFAISIDGAYVMPFTHIEDYDFVAVSAGIQWW